MNPVIEKIKVQRGYSRGKLQREIDTVNRILNNPPLTSRDLIDMRKALEKAAGVARFLLSLNMRQSDVNDAIRIDREARR